MAYDLANSPFYFHAQLAVVGYLSPLDLIIFAIDLHSNCSRHERHSEIVNDGHI